LRRGYKIASIDYSGWYGYVPFVYASCGSGVNLKI